MPQRSLKESRETGEPTRFLRHLGMPPEAASGLVEVIWELLWLTTAVSLGMSGLSGGPGLPWSGRCGAAPRPNRHASSARSHMSPTAPQHHKWQRPLSAASFEVGPGFQGVGLRATAGEDKPGVCLVYSCQHLEGGQAVNPPSIFVHAHTQCPNREFLTSPAVLSAP